MLNTSSSISYTLLGFVTDIILFILLETWHLNPVKVENCLI